MRFAPIAKLSTLLPSACALCGEHGQQVLCSPCQQHYLGTAQQRCRQCALPVTADVDGADRVNSTKTDNHAVCGAWLRDAPAFDYTITACNYAAPLDQLVLNLKFGHQLALAPVFSSLLRDAILERRNAALPDILTIVPLGKARLAERGFNQALEIARPLARQLGIPLAAQLLPPRAGNRAAKRLASG